MFLVHNEILYIMYYVAVATVVATVVATPGPVPEVAVTARLVTRREAARATAGGIAVEASPVAARVCGGSVAGRGHSQEGPAGR